MAQAIGFDRERYISMQSEHIGERRRKIGGKLYLEMGGKLFDDMHASRVLPGFTPDNKIAMLERLRDELEIVVAVNANLLAKVRADLGISYQEDVLRLVDVFRERGFLVENVVLTQMEDYNAPARAFKKRMERLGLKVAQHRRIEGYPGNTKLIVSDEGFGKNDYVETSRDLIVVTAPGPGSGKLATCLSQLFHEHRRGITAGYAKFETFPIWNLPLDHPVNVAYEAATARRWLRAAASSADRATLWRAGREGLREGLARPADNMTIFLGTPVQDDVAAVEAAARASAGPTSPSPGPPSPATADPAGTPAPPFSVLLPVYRGDRADFLRRSLASVTVEQTLPPDEVLIVRDGPVPGELDDVLAAARRGELSGGVPVRVLELAENAGLALALDAGLEHVAHEVVARQDADDISVPERFATQLPLLAAGYDLIGSAIREFSEETDTGGVVRRQPADPERIRRAMTLRDPFNHPSVVYRASAVRAAGGYEPLDLMEDYWLFARMIRDGVRATNVPDVLVRYRVGAGAYARRGGGRLLHSELELQARMHRAGITTTAQYVRNIAVRAGYRLVPTGVRRTAYRTAQRALLKRTR